jgi:hypothetical protein
MTASFDGNKNPERGHDYAECPKQRINVSVLNLLTVQPIERTHQCITICGALQLPVTDWHEYLGGGRLADAILDRLVHASHRIEIASKDSMRKPRPDLLHAGQSDI